MRRPVAVLLRFDTEDFLTPESDDAALFLARTLERRGLRATFPITGWKVKALHRRGRQDVLQALSQHAVGYHSLSHSLHPTIAEELADVPDDAAEERFRRREEAGFLRVAERLGRRPCAYTQPGGNWVAEATAALRAWGVPLYHSEDWNSYIDVAGRPYFLGGVLAYAGAVAAPKPFLSRLPEALPRAMDQLRTAIDRAADAEPGGVGLVHVVSHPTELVTEIFWDQVNFAAGQNLPRDAWAPPALRAATSVQRAKGALEEWLDALKASGAETWTAEDLVAAFPDAAAGKTFGVDDARAIAAAWERGAVGSVAVRGVSLTPAEALTVLAGVACALGHGQDRPRVAAARPAAPWGASEAATASGPAPSHAAVLRAAPELCGADRLPAKIALEGRSCSLLDASVALARTFLHLLGGGRMEAECPLPTGTFLPAAHVRPPEQLHWDWPIFPPGFRPVRLRQRAVDAVWTLKPAEAALCDLQS